MYQVGKRKTTCGQKLAHMQGQQGHGSDRAPWQESTPARHANRILAEDYLHAVSIHALLLCLLDHLCLEAGMASCDEYTICPATATTNQLEHMNKVASTWVYGYTPFKRLKPEEADEEPMDTYVVPAMLF